MKLQYVFSLICVALLLSSCEDVIDVELGQGSEQLVVDAWINNMPVRQTIRLSQASPYFDSTPAPGVKGATVQIIDNEGNQFNFTDNQDGDYYWDPEAGTGFGKVGNVYTLSIQLNGQEYTATSSMKRIMPIDSIRLEQREEELGQPEGVYAELFARDFTGVGDAYWIKTYKNGLFLNKPQEMNIAYDAGFTAGAMVDGVIFITPIRQNVNRVPDSGDDAVDNSDLPPWSTGDDIRIEIHSLNEDAFFFLTSAFTQMTLGDASIFAEPPSNVPSNIISASGTEPASKAIGFFNVAAVSFAERTVE